MRHDWKISYNKEKSNILKEELKEGISIIPYGIKQGDNSKSMADLCL